jgi:hypothetical protein
MASRHGRLVVVRLRPWAWLDLLNHGLHKRVTFQCERQDLGFVLPVQGFVGMKLQAVAHAKAQDLSLFSPAEQNVA